MITTANSEAEETPQGSLERQTEEAPKKPAKLKSSTFTNGQTVQYRVGTTVMNTAVTWNTAYTIETNVNALMTAINNNTAATDVAARLWHSNNASGTFYLQLYYTQPGNWKGQSLNVYVNGATNNASVKRAMGYGTSKGSDIVGSKRYELANHLGNVLSVITDRKWAVDDGQFNTTTGIKTSSTFDGLADYYVATIVSYSDYDPFGTIQDGRKSAATDYRYGFNGKEADDEVKNEGNSYEFGARMYDPRLGKFLSIDPKSPIYLFMSPYCYAANNPIYFTDQNGEGPLATLISTATWFHAKLAKWTGRVVKMGISAQIIAGMGFASAGVLVEAGIAIDKKGNIGIYKSGDAFAVGLVGEDCFVSSSNLEDANYNIVAGAEVGITANVSFDNKKNVLGIAGANSSVPGVGGAFDLAGGVSGSVQFDGQSFGLGVGLGVGAAISRLSSRTFVFAFRIKDIEKFENAVDKVQDIKSKYKNVKVEFSVKHKKNGFNSVYGNIEYKNKRGKIKHKQVEFLSVRMDETKNAIYTERVKL